MEAFADAIRGAKTILWNGPTGVFEMENFSAGTKQVAKAVAECKGVTVIGGGDSAAAVEQFGFADQMIVLERGTIRLQGTPEEVYSAAIIPEVFGVDLVKTGNESGKTFYYTRELQHE